MFEKVNPSHPDKCCDRIAGAIVDLAYQIEENPKIAVEVLLGHGICHVIIETSVYINESDIEAAITRIAVDDVIPEILQVEQDPHLADNQKDGVRCGDNGIFKGVPTSKEESTLSRIAKEIYTVYPYDGKYILDEDKLIICQSMADSDALKEAYPNAIVNPLGDWSGGPNVDTGATNRKLDSDMGRAVTGGGLHGKDLSKADVSVNIYAFLRAKKAGEVIELSCAIGDDEIDGLPYEDIVEIARDYIDAVGGFEKFAEWGLI